MARHPRHLAPARRLPRGRRPRPLAPPRSLIAKDRQLHPQGTTYPLAMDAELFEHFLRDDSRVGAPLDGGYTGAAGGAACGDLSRISLTIADARVAAVSFDAEGCGASRAATAAVAEMVDGGSVLAAARIGIDEVEAALGGL